MANIWVKLAFRPERKVMRWSLRNGKRVIITNLNKSYFYNA